MAEVISIAMNFLSGKERWECGYNLKYIDGFILAIYKRYSININKNIVSIIDWKECKTALRAICKATNHNYSALCEIFVCYI